MGGAGTSLPVATSHFANASALLFHACTSVPKLKQDLKLEKGDGCDMLQ